jgi:hypothetical protein
MKNLLNLLTLLATIFAADLAADAKIVALEM